MSARHIIPKRPVPPKNDCRHRRHHVIATGAAAKVASLYLRAKQPPLAYPTPAATKARLRPSRWWLAGLSIFWARILPATHHVPKEAAASQLIFSNLPSLFICWVQLHLPSLGCILPLLPLREKILLHEPNVASVDRCKKNCRCKFAEELVLFRPYLVGSKTSTQNKTRTFKQNN